MVIKLFTLLDELLKEIADLNAEAFAGGVRRSVSNLDI